MINSTNINAITDHFESRIILLGSGQYSAVRAKARQQLIKKGYKQIVVMERYWDNEDDFTLDDKFRRILEITIPDVIFALFHNGARMDGVTFEIGWLCSKYTIPEISSRLVLLYEYGYDWNSTTSYIPSLMTSRVASIPFCDSNIRTRVSEVIHNRLRSPRMA